MVLPCPRYLKCTFLVRWAKWLQVLALAKLHFFCASSSLAGPQRGSGFVTTRRVVAQLLLLLLVLDVPHDDDGNFLAYEISLALATRHQCKPYQPLCLEWTGAYG